MPRLNAAHIPILSFLFLALANAAALPAHAQSTADKKKIEAAIEAKQAAEAELAEKARALQNEATALQKKLVDMSKGLRQLEEDLAGGKTRMAELQRQKSVLAARLYDEQETVGGLVTAAQRFNRTSTPSMLAQSDPLDAARAARLMKSLIPQVHEKSAALRAEIAALEKVESGIAEERARQQKSLAAINAEEAKLGKLLEERRKAIVQTEAERKTHNAEVARLTREAKSLDDLVQQIERPRAKPAVATRTAGRDANTADAATPVGTVNSPVPGTIRTAFGETDDMGAVSKGIVYHARGNARVVTPLAGVVRFAGPFNKYKQILIVEHPGGYHSLIAGLGRVDTVVGARVAAGEPVGSVDNTDAEHHPVYYELRRNGNPVNPQKILVAQRKQDKT